MPRQRIKIDRDEEGKLKEGSEMYNEDIEEEEEPIAEEEEEESAPEDSITVNYRERSIKRTFGKGQVLQSGGNLKRIYSSRDHGKKYRKLACQFIETMMLEDDDTHIRARFASAVGLTKEEIALLDLNANGTPKRNPNGTGIVPVPIAPEKARSQFDD